MDVFFVPLRNLLVVAGVIFLVGCGRSDLDAGSSSNRRLGGSSSRLDDTFGSGPTGSASRILSSGSDRRRQTSGSQASGSRPAPGGEQKSTSSSYAAPYPDRNDPFLFPDAAGETPDTSAGRVIDIEVLGFAQLSDPARKQVLLRTRSGIKSLGIGDRVNGITVLKINEPTVELKLGTLIWTASLFDSSRADRAP